MMICSCARAVQSSSTVRGCGLDALCFVGLVPGLPECERSTASPGRRSHATTTVPDGAWAEELAGSLFFVLLWIDSFFRYV